MSRERRNKEREKRIALLSDAIDHQDTPNPKKYPLTKSESFIGPLPKKEGLKYEEIASVRKIEIPKCLSQPINGRIYVIEAAGGETVTQGGIVIAHRLNVRKNESTESIKRYFVVAYDIDDIPQSIVSKLSIGIEVNPFLPQEAEEWSLPKVIDWQTGNTFKSLHYTELAGISMVKPEKAE